MGSSPGEAASCSGARAKFRGGGFQPRPVRGGAVAVFVVPIALLEAGTRSGAISNLTMPRPSAVLEILRNLAVPGLLWPHLAPSFMPLVPAPFPIPKIALMPPFVIWVGTGESSKHALIAFGTFPPAVLATFGAVGSVDRTRIRIGQSFGLSCWSIVRKIVLPRILSGLRVPVAIAVILLVAAGLRGAEHGIGARILESGALCDLERPFARVRVLSVPGLILGWAIGLIEQRFLGWKSWPCWPCRRRRPCRGGRSCARSRRRPRRDRARC
ncbi:ABC transporter permease [Mangrovicoccus ximenensis]|uniref:ABC transporter permease n=1 Tax=Mangrovicoccus ximenensis TaxID=1911570 RepID=UPI001F01ACEB|nr:ABC transporter permease subunit [Mangrovicoccus ximenensis]